MNNSVIVTGAANGLGLETALLLAERGFRVYGTILEPSERAPLEADAADRGVALGILQLDITDPPSIDRAVDTIVRETGGIFGLVNNAGTRLRGCFEDLTDAEIRRVFNVNVFGTMAMTRAVLPHLRRARGGRIVMITSVGGRIGAFGVGAYCATKFAQEGFGESLAQEVAPFGIKVVLIEPSIVRTEAWGAHRVVGAGAEDPDSPYRAWFRHMEQLTDGLVQSSPTTVNDVAEAVHRAMTVTRPRLRYMVGRRARRIMALRRYLPGELFEKLYFGRVLRKITAPPVQGADDA